MENKNKQSVQLLYEIAQEMLYSPDPISTLEQKAIRRELSPELLASAAGLAIAAKIFGDRALSDQERVERLFLALQRGEIDQQLFSVFAGELVKRIQEAEKLNQKRVKLDCELQRVNQQNKKLLEQLQKLEGEFQGAGNTIAFFARLLQRWQSEYANVEPELAKEALRDILRENAESVSKNISEKTLQAIEESKILRILPDIEKRLKQLSDVQRVDFIIDLIKTFLAPSAQIIQKRFEVSVEEVIAFKKKLINIISDWLEIIAVIGTKEKIEALNQVIGSIDNIRIRTMLQKAFRPEEEHHDQ
ncbi:MAG: hypothetical protein QXK26_03935 [Candidatus Bathyarchaeia archaeon]